MNAVTIANNARLMANMRRHPQKKYKRVFKEAHVLLRTKFFEAWQQQEERLQQLKIEQGDSYSNSKTGDFRVRYRYESGQTAKIEIKDKEGTSVERFDEMGNSVETRMFTSTETIFYKCVYYPNSNQEEFVLSDTGSIQHFTIDGKDDTERYLAKLQMASKRIRYEKETGVTLRKMTKLEKAVAKSCKDKPEMTFVEKMLARKAKRSGK